MIHLQLVSISACTTDDFHQQCSAEYMNGKGRWRDWNSFGICRTEETEGKVLEYSHTGLEPMPSRLDRKKSNRQSCPDTQDPCSIVLLHPTSKNISPIVSLLYYYPQTYNFHQEWEPQHCLSTLVWLFGYCSFPFLKTDNLKSLLQKSRTALTFFLLSAHNHVSSFTEKIQTIDSEKRETQKCIFQLSAPPSINLSVPFAC